MARLRGFLIGIAALLAACSLSASTITVDLSGGGDHSDIQSAVDAANDGDTVLVGPGEYVILGPIDFNRLHSPDDPSSPPVKDIVLRSADGPEATTIRAGILPDMEDYTGNAVLFASGESEASMLEGFTIRGVRNWNGGVVVQNSSPTIRGCVITDNRGNTAGGIHCENASPRIMNCRIAGNYSDEWGGGISCWDGSSPLISGCTIEDNLSIEWGGGVLARRGSAPVLVNCAILGNRSPNAGAAVYSSPGDVPRLIHCTVSGNVSSKGGAAVRCDGECGAMAPILESCIVWGNSPGPIEGSVTSCITDVDPLFVSAGRLEDPGTPSNLRDDTWIPGDYRLRAGSPAIDAGKLEGAPTSDIEGHGRPCGSGVDIGAYEFGGCTPPVRFRRGDVDANGALEITDPIKLLGYLFLGESSPLCLDAGDVDDSGALDITDAVYSLSFQFLGGAKPASPFQECGIDPTIDTADCQSYPGCS